jgi:hypothetical protein
MLDRSDVGGRAHTVRAELVQASHWLLLKCGPVQACRTQHKDCLTSTYNVSSPPPAVATPARPPAQRRGERAQRSTPWRPAAAAPACACACGRQTRGRAPRAACRGPATRPSRSGRPAAAATRPWRAQRPALRSTASTVRARRASRGRPSPLPAAAASPRPPAHTGGGDPAPRPRAPATRPRRRRRARRRQARRPPSATCSTTAGPSSPACWRASTAPSWPTARPAAERRTRSS